MRSTTVEKFERPLPATAMPCSLKPLSLITGALLPFLWASPGEAQVALNAFRPTPVAADGFAVSRPVALPHLTWNGTLWVDYAKRPLTYTLGRQGRDDEVAI